MAMMIGVTPAMSAPNTAIRTMIAATMPIDSPNRRSSSETFRKSSVDVASPRMNACVPPAFASSRIASTSSTCSAASSTSPAMITVNRTACPSSDGNGPSGAVCGSSATSAGSGNAGARRSRRRDPARSVPGAPCSPSRRRRILDRALLGTGDDPVLRHDVLLEAPLLEDLLRLLRLGRVREVDVGRERRPQQRRTRRPASTKITSQTATVRQGCLLLARAMDSGLSLIQSPSLSMAGRIAPTRLTAYAYNVRSIGVRCKVSTRETLIPSRDGQEVSPTEMDAR